MEPLSLALAIGDPREEAALLSLVQEPSFRVDGRPCQVRGLFDSARDVAGAVAGDAVDVVVVASTLNAIPFERLVDLATEGRRLVVVAPDPLAPRWNAFPAPVVGMQPDADSLSEALRQAMRGRGVARPDPRTSTTQPATPSSTIATSEVIAVTSGYAAEGRSTVATALAFALGVVAETVLIDADLRGGTIEFAFGLDPGRNMCLLAQQEPQDPTWWDAALAAELQPMGAPSTHGVALTGVTKPSLRPWVTARFFEQLIAALRERYRYVVLDTSGSGWSADDSAVDRLCLRLADRVLVVVRPDTQGVMMAQRAIRERSHAPRMCLLLNQAGLSGQYSRAEIEAELRLPVVAVVPADPRGVAGARARHRPVVCQPRCRLAPPLLDLARRLCGGQPLALEPDGVDEVRPWWRRLPVGAAGGLR
jgi:Mrp family chromosome partitioning ATPase